MSTVTLSLPRLHAGQSQVDREAKRFNAMACGRRFGKSTYLIHRQARVVLRGGRYGYFAPTYKYTGDYWRDTLYWLHPIISRSNRTDGRIEFITGGSTEFWSLENENAGRSRKYHEVGIDEAGLVGNLGEIWNAAISPTLMDFEGGAFFTGTPKGRNFFFQVYGWGQDPLRTDWASWQMPTTANPFIKPSEIERERSAKPERLAAQEIDAVFLEDGGGVFRNVIECSTGTPQAPVAGRQYVIGCDFGKSLDYSVFSVWDVQSQSEVWLDRSNQIDYELQIQRLMALWERYNPIAVMPESNSIGTPIIERMQRLGMRVQPFTTTNASKSAIVDGMALALERKAITLLNDTVATNEMLSFEMERLPSGVYRYSAPEGQHDDTVMARCIALSGISQTPRVATGSNLNVWKR